METSVYLNAMWTTSLTCAEVAGFVRTLPVGVHSARRLGCLRSLLTEVVSEAIKCCESVAGEKVEIAVSKIDIAVTLFGHRTRISFSMQSFRGCQLYSTANDPETANDPRPQVIPKVDRK